MGGGSREGLNKARVAMAVELLVYADESGIHSDASYCVICGYFASPRQWRLFEESWTLTLQAYGVPEFHAYDFFTRGVKRSGHYRDWARERAKAFINGLLSNVASCRLHPVGGAVDVRGFKEFSDDERRFLTGGVLGADGSWLTTGAPSKPYYVAFQILLTEAAQRAKENATVHFVLDQQRDLAPWAEMLFKRIASERRHKLWDRLGQISYADRRKAVCLQAADLYSHLVYSYATKRAGMGSEREYALSVLAKRRKSVGVWTARQSQDLLQRAVALAQPGQRRDKEP